MKNFLNSDGSHVDTQRTLYYQSGDFSTYNIRILRIYLRLNGNPQPANPPLTYRTFEPLLLQSSTFGGSVYEGMAQTIYRAQCWLNAAGSDQDPLRIYRWRLELFTITMCSLAGVTPVAVETACMVQAHNQPLPVSERTLSRESGSMSTSFLLCPRFYFRQHYNEPHPSQLPPPPPVAASQSQECCTIL